MKSRIFQAILLLLVPTLTHFSAWSDEFPEALLVNAFRAVKDEDVTSLRKCFYVEPVNKSAATLLDACCSMRIAKQRMDRLALTKLNGTVETIYSTIPVFQDVDIQMIERVDSALSKSTVHSSSKIAKIEFRANHKDADKKPADPLVLENEIWFIKQEDEWKIDFDRLALVNIRKGHLPAESEQQLDRHFDLLLAHINSEATKYSDISDQIESGKITSLKQITIMPVHPTTQATKENSRDKR